MESQAQLKGTKGKVVVKADAIAALLPATKP